MAVTAPSGRDGFEIAIICAIKTEYDAVCRVYDEFWDEDNKRYGRARGDVNIYTTGRIGNHNVVIALLPDMGKATAAAAAASFRHSYCGLELALLIGVCGGVPHVGNGADEEIFLGDVVISKAVVQYDFGRQNPDSFVRKNTVDDNLSKANKNIRSLLVTFETERGLEHLEERTADILGQLQTKAQEKRGEKYGYPGTAEDRLFAPSYRHKHRVQPCSTCDVEACETASQETCEQLGCQDAHLVTRKRLQEKQQPEQTAQRPVIHIGAVASGDAVMRSGEHRDKIAKREGVIAFEMEGAGVWEEVPCIVIKGVCDYADCHKNKKWQAFAAATAASAAKAVIERYPKTDRPAAEQLRERTSTVERSTPQQPQRTWNTYSGPVFNGGITSTNFVADMNAQNISNVFQ